MCGDKLVVQITISQTEDTTGTTVVNSYQRTIYSGEVRSWDHFKEIMQRNWTTKGFYDIPLSKRKHRSTD
jgi:hypothetical protein